MTAPTPGPEVVPTEVAAALAPDLVAIVGYLVAQAGQAGQPAGRLAALGECHAVLADFHQEALAWAAGPGPVPCWQSWANRLALALGDLLGALDTEAACGGEGGQA